MKVIEITDDVMQEAIRGDTELILELRRELKKGLIHLSGLEVSTKKLVYEVVAAVSTVLLSYTDHMEITLVNMLLGHCQEYLLVNMVEDCLIKDRVEIHEHLWELSLNAVKANLVMINHIREILV